MPNPEIAPALVERFWAKVDRRSFTECWEWKGARRGRGYGTLSVNGKQEGAHRVSVMLANGVCLTSSDFVCHTCDNPVCVNPGHLYVGDHKSNMEDLVERQRHRYHGVKLCKRGHAMEGIQTGGYRSCTVCKRARDHARDLRDREKIILWKREYRKRVRQEQANG